MANGAVLEPSGEFPAWLEAQGVNAEVAQAMDLELGIRDYGVLRACIGDGLVRAELLATARDRLPFGFYAVLRQVVKALQGTEPRESGMPPRWDDAAVSAAVSAAAYFGDAMLGGLVDVLLMLLNGLNRELLQCMQRLGDMDILKNVAGSPSCASSDDVAHETRRRHHGDADTAEYENPEHLSQSSDHDTVKHDPSHPYDEMPEAPSSRGADECDPSLKVRSIKTEDCAEDPSLMHENISVGEHVEWEEPVSVPGAEPPGQSLLASPPGLIVDSASSSQPTDVDLSHATTDLGAFPWGQQTAGNETRIQESSVDAPTAITYALPCPLPPPQSRAFRPGRPPPVHKLQRLSISESGLYELKPCGPRLGAGKVDPSRRPAPAAAAMGGRDKPYRCKVCGCSFMQYSTLKRHLHKHNGERPYCCSACGRGFSQLSELRVHEDTHRREKPYHCRVCDQAFARSCHLTRHQRMHTGEKPYRCGACGHAFAQSCDLKTHERTHTGEKPYRCDACGRGFAQGAHLKRHQRTHSSRKPYRCRPCGRTFVDFGSFNAHQLTHMQNVAANRTVAAAVVAEGLAGADVAFADVAFADGNGVP